MKVKSVKTIRINAIYPELTIIQLDNGQYIDVNTDHYQISVDIDGTQKNEHSVTLIKK